MQLNGYLSYLIYAASIVYAAPTAKRASGSTGYSGGSTANDIKDGGEHASLQPKVSIC